jgi:hypothetical protein
VARRLAALLFTLAGVSTACDRTVTSVGSWEPLSQPSAGQGGSGGGGAGGVASGGGGIAPSDAGEAGQSGAPPQDGLYLEAESGELSGGFTVETDTAASGGQYLQAPLGVTVPDDMEGAAHARYTFSVPEDGDYLIWGRIYSPDIYTNRFHFQVDGGTRYLWRITVGNIWYWDDFHDNADYNEPLHFQLSAGTHELLLSNVAGGARLDRLYITANGDEPPGNNTKCRPPHNIDLDGVCHDSCGAQATPERGTSCSCAAVPEAERFEAYDCGSGKCCFLPATMP